MCRAKVQKIRNIFYYYGLCIDLWLVPLALSVRFFLLRLFKMIFIMKKKHRKRCFGIAVCKFKEFRYKIGIFRQ